MIVIGIDPGYAIVGFGIVKYLGSKFLTLDYGAIETPAGMEMPKRLEIIYDGLQTLIQKYNPEVLAVEELFFANNAKTAIAVGQGRGIVLLAAQKNGLPVFEYTPLQVKQAVVGYGRAEKRQVMEMTRILLNLTKIPKPDDAADALAIAICHAHSAGSRLR